MASAAEQTDAEGEVVAVERIYVGGLDPRRLKASEVLERLRSLQGIEIVDETVPLHLDSSKEGTSNEDRLNKLDSQPFVHFNAVVTASDSTKMTALSVIAKQYHNTKWKGCKLVVDSAKPHFLERLAEERRNRINKASAVAQPQQEEAVPSLRSLSNLPRRLRVRKKHGDKAFHVDTKPWSVGDWPGFDVARGKLQKRIDKHKQQKLVERQQQKLLMRKSRMTDSDDQTQQQKRPLAPLMHRAIHIRFQSQTLVGDPADGDYHASVNLEDRTKESHSASLSSSSSSSSEAEDNSDDNDLDINGHQDLAEFRTNEAFVWTDEEKNGEEEKEEALNSMAEGKHDLNSKSLPKGEEGKYHWSSDEHSDSNNDDGEEDMTGSPPKDLYQLSNSRTNDEFATGLEEFDASGDELITDTENGDEARTSLPTNSVDLTDDVTTNLGILASLFPDLENTQPAVMMDTMGEGDRSKETLDIHKQKQDGDHFNDAFGFMPRYDPSMKSSQKYLVDEDNAEKSQGVEKEENRSDNQTSSDQDEVSEDEAHSESQEINATSFDVYEEKKLEGVFAKARDAWTKQDAQPAQSRFAFGFELGGGGTESSDHLPPAGTSTNTSTPSFFFHFNSSSSHGGKETDPSTDDTPHESKSSNGDEPMPSGSLEVPRRRGPRFTDADLQLCVDQFYACNNGQDVIRNPETFYNSKRDREDWNLERHTLTLDWKRKRKYATTRMKKRKY